MARPTAMASVRWRDLVPMNRAEVLWELALPLPWLALSLWCYGRGGAWMLVGALGSFYLFLTGLRQSHGAQHYSLCIPRKAQDAVLFGLSLVMLASMHAVQVSHLHHHQHCLDDEDTEGTAAHMSWWRAILFGPVFLLNLHRTAWRLGSRTKRRWIAAEVGGALLVLTLAGWVLPWPSLQWHATAMLTGECLTAFFAVWTVHHDCQPTDLARTQRGRWINRLCYSMFYHAEHHQFPAVPTCHLAALASRLDEANREQREHKLVINPWNLPEQLCRKRGRDLSRNHRFSRPFADVCDNDGAS